MLTRPLCSQDLHFAVSYSPATVSLVQFYSRVPITPYEEVMNAPIVTDQPVEEERKHQSHVVVSEFRQDKFALDYKQCLV